VYVYFLIRTEILGWLWVSTLPGTGNMFLHPQVQGPAAPSAQCMHAVHLDLDIGTQFTTGWSIIWT